MFVCLPFSGEGKLVKTVWPIVSFLTTFYLCASNQSVEEFYKKCHNRSKLANSTLLNLNVISVNSFILFNAFWSPLSLFSTCQIRLWLLTLKIIFLLSYSCSRTIHYSCPKNAFFLLQKGSPFIWVNEKGMCPADQNLTITWLID